MADPNPFEQWRVTPPPTPALPDNPFAQYGEVRNAPAKPAARSTWDMIDNYVRQFAAGGSFFTADELASAGDAALVMPNRAVTGQGPTAGEQYNASLKANRDKDKAFTGDYPITSGIAQAGGALAALPAMVPKAMWGGGKTLLSTMLRGAGGGAALGGAAGLGQGEGSFKDRAKSAGYGAAIGTGAGALLPPLIATGGAIAKPLGGRWMQENVGAPALDKLADVTAYLTPKGKPGSLSAAAPDGGPGIPMAGMMDNITEALRGGATGMRNIPDREAMDMLAKSIMRGPGSTRSVGETLDMMGPEAMLANAAGTPAQNLLRTAYMMPGNNTQKIKDALEAQAAGAPGRVRAPFEGEQPPPTMYDARRYLDGAPEGAPYGTTPAPSQGYISQVGRENYPPAWEAGKGWTGGMGPQTPDIQRLMQNPAIKEAFDQVTADAAKYGREVDPLQIAHLVKQQLNKNVDAAFSSGRAVNKDFVRGLADDWEKALWEANPKLATADKEYAIAKGLPDRLDQGYSWMRTGAGAEDLNVSTSALADQFPRMLPGDQTMFRVGSTNAVRDITDKGANAARGLARNINDSTGIQEKVGSIYPDQVDSILRMARTEKGMGEMKNRVMGGSDSAPKLADMAEQGGPAMLRPGGGSLTSRAWDAVMDQGRKLASTNETVRDAYVKVLLEQNPTQNLKNLEILDAMIQAQLNGSVGRAGAAAVTGGQGGDMMRVKR